MWVMSCVDVDESESGLGQNDYSNVIDSHDYDHDQQNENGHHANEYRNVSGYVNGFQNVNVSLLHVNGSACAHALCFLEVMSEEVNVNESVDAEQWKQA